MLVWLEILYKAWTTALSAKVYLAAKAARCRPCSKVNESWDLVQNSKQCGKAPQTKLCLQIQLCKVSHSHGPQPGKKIPSECLQPPHSSWCLQGGCHGMMGHRGLVRGIAAWGSTGGEVRRWSGPFTGQTRRMNKKRKVRSNRTEWMELFQPPFVTPGRAFMD